MYLDNLEPGDFFLRFSLSSTRINGVFWHQKRRFPKKGLYSGDFWKRRLLVYLWTDENRGFGYDNEIHHILLELRMLCRGCYPFIVQSRPQSLRYFCQWSSSLFKRIASAGNAIVHRFIVFTCTTCGCLFFWKRRKNLSFQKYWHTCGRSLPAADFWMSRAERCVTSKKRLRGRLVWTGPYKMYLHVINSYLGIPGLTTFFILILHWHD